MMVLLEYIAVGLVGASLLIILAKGIMARILQRDLGYYKDAYDEAAGDAAAVGLGGCDGGIEPHGDCGDATGSQSARGGEHHD